MMRFSLFLCCFATTGWVSAQPVSNELEWVWVEGGTFNMGCTEEQADCSPHEYPVHTVTLNGFYISKYEITIHQFKAFVDATGYVSDAQKLGESSYYDGVSWSAKKGADWTCGVKAAKQPLENYNHPVMHVSWQDAVAYCQWLSQKTGNICRIPTEAEWEYAARGGIHQSPFRYAGSNNLDAVAWHGGNSGAQTHPVGLKQPNVLGIYDMSGNAWEWCYDWMGEYTADSQTNPQGASHGWKHIMRGGGWLFSHDCRIACRNSGLPYECVDDLGIRVLMQAPNPNAINKNQTATEMELVFVEGGTFNMGCTGEQENCYDHEKPVHPVTVSSFYMGKYEVTIAQFKAFVDATGYVSDAQRLGESSYYTGTTWAQKKGADWTCGVKADKQPLENYNHPVMHVSCQDGMAYCKWLSQKTGQTYRIPTEAEWEYAARGGAHHSPYRYAGSDDLDAVAWHGGNSSAQTHPVGLKQPNALGLYDMSGNAWEWCQDWHGLYPETAQTNPKGPAQGEKYIMRGGGWLFSHDCRTSYRNTGRPDECVDDLGFRVVMEVPKP